MLMWPFTYTLWHSSLHLCGQLAKSWSLASSAGALESDCEANERIHQARWDVPGCGLLCKRFCSRTQQVTPLSVKRNLC